MDLEKVGIGVDTEDIKRFEKYCVDMDNAFLKKVYTENELEYCFKSKHPARHLAVRFSGKEAIYKAFCSIGITGLGFHDVEIVHDSNRVPQVNFLCDRIKNYSCKITLSHSRENAVAFVIVSEK